MHSNDSDFRIAYTYLIGWSHLDKWYYGVRYSKNCNPGELWVSYFTSSKHVSRFREVHGEPDIIQPRMIFTDIQLAIRCEHRVLKNIDVKNNDKWINVTDSKALDITGLTLWNNGVRHTWSYNSPGPEWTKGRFMSEESREKLSKSCRGRVSSFKGRQHTDETKQLISMKNSGANHPFYNKSRPEFAKKISKIMKGKRKSKEHKKAISKTHNVIYTCPHCLKSGGRIMLRWHFDKCKMLK